MFATGLLAEHRVESHQFINIDRLQTQPGRSPFDGLSGQIPEMLLQRVQKHQRGAPLLRIMRQEFTKLRLYFGWNVQTHRSASPITKSNDPKIATTSLIMWPRNKYGSMLRFTNDGARILRRLGV